MQFKIDINLDNSAYENLSWELGDNLQAVIDRISLGAKEGIVRDSNGNKVGQWGIYDAN